LSDIRKSSSGQFLIMTVVDTELEKQLFLSLWFHLADGMMAKKKKNHGHYISAVKYLPNKKKPPDLREYPFTIPVVRRFCEVDQLDIHPKVTYLVGENGTGKSTLIEGLAYACDLNPEGGSRNFNFSTRDTYSILGLHLRAAKTNFAGDSYFLRAETFYNVATEVERLGVRHHYGGKPLHEQSHGESFFSLFVDRFVGQGLYILDEPEAALSPSRQLSFLSLMHEYCDEGSQFIIATHSPIIMAYPEAHIYLLDTQGGLNQINYKETEHYKVTRAFLDNPEKMMRILFE